MPVTIERVGKPVDGQSIMDFVKAATISAAERVLREEVGKGFDNAPVVVTDGVPQRDYRQVKAFGRIEFISNTSMADAVRWALAELKRRSPVLTGRYSMSHLVMINGAMVEGNLWAALRKVKPSDRVQIVNTVPYARKIEGATANKRTGRGKRQASSRQAKGGVYRPVLRALVQRYGKSMFFDYKMVKLNLGVKVWGDQGGSYYNRLKKNGGGWVKHKVKRVQRDQVYPAIQIFMPNARSN